VAPKIFAYIAVLSLTWPGAVLADAAPQVARGAANKSIKLEGMEYMKARSIILSYGWKPWESWATHAGRARIIVG
jgi:hypothetical protein